jgi:hypothetical protein
VRDKAGAQHEWRHPELGDRPARLQLH